MFCDITAPVVVNVAGYATTNENEARILFQVYPLI